MPISQNPELSIVILSTLFVKFGIVTRKGMAFSFLNNMAGNQIYLCYFSLEASYYLNLIQIAENAEGTESHFFRNWNELASRTD